MYTGIKSPFLLFRALKLSLNRVLNLNIVRIQFMKILCGSGPCSVFQA